MVAFFEGANISCEGALAPGRLFTNILVVVGIIICFDTHMYQWIKLTGRSRTKMVSNPVVKGVLTGAVIGLEALFKYIIQILCLSLDFRSFYSVVGNDYIVVDKKTDEVSCGWSLVALMGACEPEGEDRKNSQWDDKTAEEQEVFLIVRYGNGMWDWNPIPHHRFSLECNIQGIDAVLALMCTGLLTIFL